MIFSLALRYILRRKMRALLTTLAIIFGVALVIAVRGMIPAFENSLKQSVLESMGGSTILHSKSKAPFPEDIARKISAEPGVKDVVPRLAKLLQLTKDAVPLPDGSSLTMLYLVGMPKGALPGGAALEIDEVMLSTTLLQKIGRQAGDTFRVPSTSGGKTLHIAKSFAAPPGPEAIYVDLESAQEILGLPGRISQISLTAAADIDWSKYGLELDDTRSQNDELLGLIEDMNAPMTFFAILAIFLAGFIIFITFRTAIARRRADLGLLRALGATRNTIIRLVLSEGLLLGIVGTALGIALGLVLDHVIITSFAEIWQEQMGFVLSPVPVSPATLVLAVGLGIGVTMLCCLFPARAAARISPQQSMRPGNTQAQGIGRARIIAGAASTVLGLLALVSMQPTLQAYGFLFAFAGLAALSPAIIGPMSMALASALGPMLGTSVRLAAKSIERESRRASITASVMVVSLMVMVALLALSQSVMDAAIEQMDRMLGADAMLMPDAAMPGASAIDMAPHVVDELRQIDGVEEVVGLIVQQTGAAGTGLTLVGLDVERYQKLGTLSLVEGEIEDVWRSLKQPRNIVVSAQWAKLSPHHIGDDVVVDTPTGPVTYHIVGVGGEVLYGRLSAGYISATDLTRDFGQRNSAMALIKLGDASAEAVIKERASAFAGIVFRSTRAWKQEQIDTGLKKMNVLYVLLFIIMGPALIALANTLSISILERIRELGLLRAIGMTRLQVKKMVLAESLLLSFLGGIFGAGLGLWLGLLGVRSISATALGATLSFPSSGLIAAAVIVVCLSLVASLLPASWAAGINIATALRRE